MVYIELDDLPIRPIYYLNNWYRYKENVQYLTDNSKRNAIRLFKALNELDEKEKEFLSMKFDREKRLTDVEASEQLGLELKEYKTYKQDLIREVGKKIKTHIKENEKNKSII